MSINSKVVIAGVVGAIVGGSAVFFATKDPVADIRCDSTQTIDTLKSIMSNKLGLEGANLEITRIVTDSLDKEARSSSCSASAKIRQQTFSDDAGFNYAVKEVSGEKGKDIYVEIHNGYQIVAAWNNIESQIERKNEAARKKAERIKQEKLIAQEAKEAGFSDVDAYKEFKSANYRVSKIEENIRSFESKELQLSARLNKLQPQYEEYKKLLDSKKSFLMDNDYLSAKSIVFTSDYNFKMDVYFKNISNTTLTSAKFRAEMYVDGKTGPVAVKKSTFAFFGANGLRAGQSQKEDIEFAGFFDSDLVTPDIRNSKGHRVVLSLISVEDGSKREIRSDQRDPVYDYEYAMRELKKVSSELSALKTELASQKEKIETLNSMRVKA